MIVGGAHFRSAGLETPSITDTLGTSYTTIFSQTLNANQRGFIAYGFAPSSGANTVSVDHVSSHFFSYGIDEFSGVHATPLDVDGGDSTGTSTAPLDTITTITANDLIIGCMWFTNAGSKALTPGTGWNQIGEQESNADECFAATFKIVTTATSYNVDWTADSCTWVVQSVAFKPAVAASGIINLSLLGVGR